MSNAGSHDASGPTLRIRNWERFQHYKDRSPPWIKLHRDLIEECEEWYLLSDGAARLLIELWIMASRSSDGTITRDIDGILWKLRKRDASKLVAELEELVAHDFIVLCNHGASTALASCLQVATPEGEAEAERETEEEGEKTYGAVALECVSEEDPAKWMHKAWLDRFGINGHPIALTQDRRQKYRAMYREQLKGTPEPQAAWDAVLEAIAASPHHNSNRAYLMPESLLLNENRRDRWVQQTLALIRDGPPGPDQELRRQQQDLADYLTARGP